MKLQSTVWKNRTVNLPNASGVKFDSDGICDLDIDQEQATYLVENIGGLSLFTGKKKEEEGSDSKESLLNNKGNLENKEAIKKNQSDLDKAKKEEEDFIQKAEAVEKINKIKAMGKLKDLASAFPKEEWKQFKTAEEFKNYLVSKL